MRGLVINFQYVLPCPHAAAGNQVCMTAGCAGVDYSNAEVKDVLLNGVADADISDWFCDTRHLCRCGKVFFHET